MLYFVRYIFIMFFIGSIYNSTLTSEDISEDSIELSQKNFRRIKKYTTFYLNAATQFFMANEHYITRALCGFLLAAPIQLDTHLPVTTISWNLPKSGWDFAYALISGSPHTLSGNLSFPEYVINCFAGSLLGWGARVVFYKLKGK